MSGLATTRGGEAGRQEAWAGTPATNAAHRSSAAAASESDKPETSILAGHRRTDTWSETANPLAGAAKRKVVRTKPATVRTPRTYPLSASVTRKLEEKSTERTSHSVERERCRLEGGARSDDGLLAEQLLQLGEECRPGLDPVLV